MLASTTSAVCKEKASSPVVWLVSSREHSSSLRWVEKWSSISVFSSKFAAGYRTTRDQLLFDGKLVLPKSTILLAADSVRPVGCVYQPLPVGVKLPLVDGRQVARLGCYRDSDSDGAFDELAPMASFYQSERLSKYNPIAPLGYITVSQNELPAAEDFSIVYSGFETKNYISFKICRNKPRIFLLNCFEPAKLISKNSVPSEFEMLGARFRVEEFEKNRIKIAQISASENFSFSLGQEAH